MNIEFIKSKQKGGFIKSINYLQSILLTNAGRAGLLEKWLKQINREACVYYSFWTDDWATILALLKAKKRIPYFVSRVHGYDLYEERWPHNIIPFRNFQLKHVSKIIAASLDGLHYMQSHYPVYRRKFFLQHLNVIDHGNNPFSEEDELVIVSCSSVVPLKRVTILPSLLKQLTIKVRWIHFGAGVGLDDLKKYVSQLPKNIFVELRGQVDNKLLIQFYQTQKVNLFVHLSETEGGVPLVLQEAASFGIPLLASDAGGVREIVTPETGVLLSLHFREQEAVEQMKKMLSPVYNNIEFRRKVKAYWNEKFNADKNKSELVNLLVNPS